MDLDGISSYTENHDTNPPMFVRQTYSKLLAGFENEGQLANLNSE